MSKPGQMPHFSSSINILYVQDQPETWLKFLKGARCGDKGERAASRNFLDSASRLTRKTQPKKLRQPLGHRPRIGDLTCFTKKTGRYDV